MLRPGDPAIYVLQRARLNDWLHYIYIGPIRMRLWSKSRAQQEGPLEQINRGFSTKTVVFNLVYGCLFYGGSRKQQCKKTGWPHFLTSGPDRSAKSLTFGAHCLRSKNSQFLFLVVLWRIWNKWTFFFGNLTRLL